MSLEKRVRAQSLLAARAGYVAQSCGEDWDSLPISRRKELAEAVALIRSAIVLGEQDPIGAGFHACNRHRALGVDLTFVGAVVGFYRQWGL